MLDKGRSLVAFGLVVILIFAAVACSKGKNDSAVTTQPPEATPQAQEKPSATASETATPAEKVKFSYYVNELTYKILETGINWPYIKDAANVDIELINAGDRAQYNQNLNLLMATGQLPDTLWIDLTFANQYGGEGALIDLKPLIDQHAPHIRDYFQKNPLFEKYITTNDGKIYGLMWRSITVPSWGWIYREDWANQLGLKDPTSLEEMADMLRAVKANNPSGQKDFYPLIFQNYYSALMNWMYPTFDFRYLNNNPDVYDPNFKKFIEFFRQLNDDGLIDPESARGAMTEDAMIAKVLNNGSFMFLRSIVNAQQITKDGKQFNPDMKFRSLPAVNPAYNTKKPAYTATTGYGPGNLVAITKDAKDPVGIVKFFDFLFSEEGMTLKNWGIEGQSYKVENGQKQFLIGSEDVYGVDPNTNEPNWRILIPTSFSMPSPSDDEVALLFDDEYLAELRKPILQTQQDPSDAVIVIVSVEDQPRLAELTAAAGPLRDKWIVDLVVGNKPMTEWEAFLKDMDNAGYKEIMEILERSKLK